MLGTALSLTGCPSESKPDAAAPAAVIAATPKMPEAPPPPPPLTAEDRQKALYGFGALIAERTPVKAADFNEARRRNGAVDGRARGVAANSARHAPPARRPSPATAAAPSELGVNEV